MFFEKTKNIKLVIFDLDGTLINAYPAVSHTFNWTMRKFGYPTQSHVKIKRAVGWGDRQLLAQFIGPKDLDRALRFYRAHHQSALKKGSKLLPGARSLLEYLKREGYSLAVASNRPKKFSLIVLKVLKIRAFFDYILCGDEIDFGKPHPQILKLILKRFQLRPSEAIYVGDMAIDVEAGSRAGIKTVAVLTGSCLRSEIQKARPFQIVPRVFGVKKIVRELNL